MAAVIKKGPMSLLCRIAISLVSFFWCFKFGSKVDAFAVDLYPRTPFLSVFDKRHALKPGLVCFAYFPVKAIFFLRTLTKVAGFVVFWVAVNVVDKTFGPLSGNKKPCKSLRVKEPVVDGYSDVSVWVKAPSHIAHTMSTSAFSFPSQISRIGVVIKKLKYFLGKLFCFHFTTMSSQKTFVNGGCHSKP